MANAKPAVAQATPNCQMPSGFTRVRTRFAPSPTGMLHIGALRTALFSWLFAKANGGDFVLRVEDTDQARLVKGSLENIVSSLNLMGIVPDEGVDMNVAQTIPWAKYGEPNPNTVYPRSGEYGPYLQSQRRDLYKMYVSQLLDEGKAYYAFDTQEELETAREEAQAAGVPYRYDGSKWQALPLKDARAQARAGKPYCVRFKMPTEGVIETEDALRGKTEWDAATQDDFVILKADGLPTYHFAVVVDDHEMKISHVFRGEEWLSSSPKQFCLYDAFGWDKPLFIHCSNILGADRKKLSKRHGAKGANEFVAEGILPDALFNFLALVGWSPQDDTEIMTREAIIGKFALSGLSVSPGIFDFDKLTWMNKQYIAQMDDAALAKAVFPYLLTAGVIGDKGLIIERPEFVRAAIALEKNKAGLLTDFANLTDFFWTPLPKYDLKAVQKHIVDGDATGYVKACADALGELQNYHPERVEGCIRSVAAEFGRDKGAVTHPLRVALTGREVGPSLFDLVSVLGKYETVTRLTEAVDVAKEAAGAKVAA